MRDGFEDGVPISENRRKELGNILDGVADFFEDYEDNFKSALQIVSDAKFLAFDNLDLGDESIDPKEHENRQKQLKDFWPNGTKGSFFLTFSAFGFIMKVAMRYPKTTGDLLHNCGSEHGI